MVLPRPWGDVATAVEEFEAEGGLDGVAVDALGPVPLIVGHRLEAADAAPGEAALETALGSVLALLLDDELDGLRRAVVRASKGVFITRPEVPRVSFST